MRRWLLPTIVVVIALVSGLAWWLRSRDAAGGVPQRIATDTGVTARKATAAASADTSARAPADTRVIVRVVNASGVRGLARKATLVLRDFGYDVVDFDSELKGSRTETAIEVNSGHAAWAPRLRKALGVGVITTRPDSSRYVDLTVLLGRDWLPPTEPLRP